MDAATELIRGECESCHGSTVVDRCYGCGRVVCQSCVDVFQHFGKEGLHGVGNPASAVQMLREEARVLRDRANEWRGLAESHNDACPDCKCSTCFVRRGAHLIGFALAGVVQGRGPVSRVTADYLSPTGLGGISLLCVDDGFFERHLKPVLDGLGSRAMLVDHERGNG